MWFNNGAGMWGHGGPAQAQVPVHPPQPFQPAHHAHAMAMQQAHYNAMAQQQAAAQQQQQHQVHYVQARGQDLDAEDTPTDTALQTSVTDPMSTAGGDGFTSADFFSAFRGMLKDVGIMPATGMSTVQSSIMETGSEDRSMMGPSNPPSQAPPPSNPYFARSTPPPPVNMKMEEGSTEGMPPHIRQALREAVDARHVGRLEKALQQARAAGFRHGPEVSNAREMLLHLEHSNVQDRAAALAEDAVRSDDWWKMQAAMSNLVGSGGGPKLDQLKKAMAELSKRKNAINGMRSAASARDTVKLKTAIEFALKNHIDEVHIRKAREALRTIEVQDTARQELKRAVGSKSLSAIRPAYSKAEPVLDAKYPADKEVLESAKSEMRSLATEQMNGYLRIEDTDRLDAALQDAKMFFVDDKTIADLQKKSDTMKDQRKHREKLHHALSSGKKSTIETALKSAKAASLPKEHLEAAEKELQRHQEREKEEVSRASASKTLAQARKAQDPEELRIAIASAEAAGLGGIDVVAAKEEYRSLAARSSSQRELNAALQSGDVYKLKAAIATARSAQIDEATLASAVKRLEALKDQANARRSLEAAVASGDPREIERALEKAKEAGLPPSETSKAKSVLKSSMGMDVIAQLRVAMNSDDVDELRSAANAALHAGASSADLDAAWARVRHLESLSWQRKELQAAIASGDCAKLQASIRHAEDVGVPEAETSAAKAELDRLVRKRTAQQELTMARASGSLDTLREALENARACQVDAKLIEAAEADLDSLEQGGARIAMVPTPSSGSSTKRSAAYAQQERFGSVAGESGMPRDDDFSLDTSAGGLDVGEESAPNRPSARLQKKVAFEI